ncbi:MAG: hypothetical protein AAFP22_01925 [Planctomycetota bacterium]
MTGADASPTGGAVRVRSNAKVNLALRVRGKRDDGFHELETVLLGLELAGEVTVSRADGAAPGSLFVATSGPCATADIVDGPEHLALRGAAAAREALGADDALHVAVTKGVPSRAGLGGGSADAAAAAWATLELLGGPTLGGEAVLARAADALAAVGSDCAFFFEARGRSAALATGRGERVRPFAGSPPWSISVLTPDVECATPAVYGALGREAGSVAAPAWDLDRAEALLALGVDAARAELMNDLEEAALRAEPRLGAWLDLVDEAGHGHLTLAGSGSSLFGLHSNHDEATAAVEAILAAGRERGLGFRFACVTRAEASLLDRLATGGAPTGTESAR